MQYQHAIRLGMLHQQLGLAFRGIDILKLEGIGVACRRCETPGESITS